MSDHIDRQAAINFLLDRGLITAAVYVAKQPAADVVEVVRCKNCIYFNGDFHYCDCDHWAVSDGYCHTGVRKEERNE